MRIAVASLVVLLVAACGSGTSPSAPVLRPAPVVELEPTADGWSALPVKEDLDEVSNNGDGYTGDIDVYALVMPADGRLQVSLAWDHESDFDLVLATDERGVNRLAEGIEQGPIPEYIGADVTAGQKLWIFVAGWEGEPGEYTLETILLNPGSRKFELESITDGASPLPRNSPIELVFTQDLDPDQSFDARIFFFGSSEFAPGRWCVDGNRLLFLPHIPEGPDDAAVLQVGFEYILQIPRGARGLRATTGEYLDLVEGASYRFSDWADPDPDAPPRVLRADYYPGEPWNSVSPVTFEIAGALDPDTISVTMDVDGLGAVPSATRLIQQIACGGTLVAQLQVQTLSPIPAGRVVRIRLPGTIRRLGGTSGLTGLAPAAPGEGYTYELLSR